MTDRRLVILICIIAAIILFYNLGGEFLWFDEGSIAALGENVLKFGYPKGIYNGVPVWSHHGYRAGQAYISRPWLEIYLAALGRLAFGKTNFAVRIFFTCFGYLSLILTYLLSKRLFKKSSVVPLLSLALLVTSVPFLLQMRQCAYYSLVTFATLWIIWSYLDLLESGKKGPGLFLCSGIFFLLANHGIFIMVFLGILFHYIVFSRKKEIKKHIAVSGLFLGAAFVAVAWYFKGFSYLAPTATGQIYPNISYYIRAVNKYILPYRFYLLVLFCLFIFKHKAVIAFLKKEKDVWRKFSLFGSIFLVTLVVLAFERHRFLRYIVNLIPLLIIVHAYIISKFLKWNKYFGIFLISLVIFTNIPNESGFYIALKPLKGVLSNIFGVDKDDIDEIDKKALIKTNFVNYIYEVTHKYEGPIAAIVTYLNKNATKSDRFKTPYDVIGIMYYTGLVGSKDFSEESYPEWIILRSYWTPPAFYKSRYYENIVRRYEAIKLDARDIPWENRPDDMEYHKFRTVKTGPSLVIFKRK